MLTLAIVFVLRWKICMGPPSLDSQPAKISERRPRFKGLCESRHKQGLYSKAGRRCKMGAPAACVVQREARCAFRLPSPGLGRQILQPLVISRCQILSAKPAAADHRKTAHERSWPASC